MCLLVLGSECGLHLLPEMALGVQGALSFIQDAAARLWATVEGSPNDPRSKLLI
jgi:hypothetical protein